MKYTAMVLFLVCLFGCQTPPKERKPDILLHEDISPTFWYQVWEREDGVRYIKELRRGTIEFWD